MCVRASYMKMTKGTNLMQQFYLFQNCCVVLCIVCFVSFYVLFVCKCVLPPGDNPTAVNKYIISYHIINNSICLGHIQVAPGGMCRTSGECSLS